MAIKFRPKPGTILLCDFQGSIPPEMNKKRPVVVLSSVSERLCIVVPLSTTAPHFPQKWHCVLHTQDTLPAPYDANTHWVKGDMVSTVSFERLFLPRLGKDTDGKRIYDIKAVSPKDIKRTVGCENAALSP